MDDRKNLLGVYSYRNWNSKTAASHILWLSCVLRRQQVVGNWRVNLIVRLIMYMSTYYIQNIVP